ncbi:cupredoxin domain-containing protein [Sulfuritalea sp.]|uniref:cupredoxin domain-containing protein n=1 Tax=Sulfuritalea sp. TaxID=2480090 RepID=UPI001AC1A646|nr:cupredoxin domain-containing protein [Sulfuritalea sp.]MBN8476214.1 cupredoxin domain-containing protein [Sulfuritalea sp.]
MPAALAHLLFVATLWLGLGWATHGHAQSSPLPAWTITVRDGVFAPKRVEVPAGQRIKFILKNEGPGPLEFENADLHVEKIVAAGAESFVVFKLPPGEHMFVDEFNIATGELLVIAK